MGQKYEKKILMVDSQRDSLGVALKRLGYSMNTTNTKEVDEAKNSLIEQKPLVLAYIVDEARDKMAMKKRLLPWYGPRGYTGHGNERGLGLCISEGRIQHMV